jgi:sterol 3beta-glucosyltransferase
MSFSARPTGEAIFTFRDTGFHKIEAGIPPADLSGFLEAGTPLVFIGFVSLPVRDPQRTTGIILQALSQTGRRGMIHTGWGGIRNQSLPENVFRKDYALYGWHFRRMSLVIHHGGSVTTAMGLRSGNPSYMVSFVFDQDVWGERITTLGAGLQTIRYRDLTVGRFRDPILLGVNSAQMRD